ncbi:hypothetical protein [Xenorhabdus sp. PB30.3]|uniref:hypothetical protein n=1 Tax=Xenorhabdus sp. PB30.3 TaxID=2788941 RepID=UPI001E59E8C7|nr:hypothetical protein [Xenorhabdus sp. PB30.3]MCC8379053.1 hypothetical protein [Xenorhabdus sp. PB30.3]
MVNTALDLQEQERIINAIEKASDAELSALAAIRTDIRTLFKQNRPVNADNNGLMISRPTRRVSTATQPNALGLKLIEAEKASPKNPPSIDSIQHKNGIKTHTVSIPNTPETENGAKQTSLSTQTEQKQHKNRIKIHTVSIPNTPETENGAKQTSFSTQTEQKQNKNRIKTRTVSIPNTPETENGAKQTSLSTQTEQKQNKNRIKTRTVSIPNENQTAKTLKRAPHVNPLNDIHPVSDAQIKNREKETIPNVVSLKSYLANKQALNSDQKTRASIAAKNIKAGHETAPATAREPHNGHNPAQPRTASGRFASKEKSESLKAHQQETQDTAKMQAGFLRKLGGLIGHSGKALADTKAGSTLDVVGSAGGSFWKAGKEAATLTKNAANNVVSLHDWVNGKRKKKQPATQQAAVSRPTLPAPTMGGGKQTQSAQAFATQHQNDQTKAIQAQTQLARTNDEKVISLLEDLVDKGKAKNGDGILGTIFSALAVKAIGKKIGRKLGAAILSALALGKLKSLFSKSGAGGAEGNGIDIDVTGHDKKKPKKTKAKNKKGLKNLGRGAAKTTAAVAGTAGAITAGEAILGQAEGKAAEKATQTTATKGAEKATESGATKVAKSGTGKGAAIAAGKMAGKTALKAVPLVGTAIGVGWDAYDGFTDTDAQRETFGLADDQDVSTRQQTEYALANVADLGGLVSGGAGLLADGAQWLGMDSVSEALTFDTGDIAKTIDNGVTAIDKKVTAVLDFFSFGDDKDDPKKENEIQQVRQSQAENAALVQAVTEGADQTTQAVNKLTNQMPPLGTEMGHDGKSVPVNVFSPTTPAQNQFSDGLNIGGKNAQNRNFRNNNFGNLVYVGQKGARLEDANAKGEQRFAKFDTPEEGMRALANQITSYANGTSKAVGYQKLNTVESIITKYAPKNENHTEGYIANLSKALGVNADQQLDLSNPDIMTKMIRAISTIEGGNPQVTDDFIRNAIGTRSDSAQSWIGQFSPETLAHVNKSRAEKGLNALSAADQFSAPEQLSATAKAQKNITPVTQPAAATPEENKTGIWSNIKNARQMADEKLTRVLAGNVTGIRQNRPDAGLTLPANMQADNLPVGLRAAMLPADQIARANKNRPPVPVNPHTETKTGKTAPQNGSADTQKYPDTPSADPISPGGIPVVPVSAVNQARPVSVLPEPEQAPDKPPVAGAGSSTWQTLADIVLPSMADTAKNLTQGFSSSGLLADLLGQTGLDQGTTQALTPLTGFVSGQIDGGVHGMIDSVTDTVRQPVSRTHGRLPQTTLPDPANPQDRVAIAQAKPTAPTPTAPTEPPSGGFLQTVADIALPSLADTAKSLTQGFSSGGLLGDLLNQTGLDQGTIRALNPLTGFVSGQIDGGIHGMIDSMTDTLRQPVDMANLLPTGTNSPDRTNTLANTVRQPAGITLPSRLPTVTNLAASGIKTPVTRDKSSSNDDKAMLTQLQKIAASLDKLISVQQDANSNGKDPNTTTHSAQPAPRSDIPLGAASNALSEMLRDRDD